MTWKLEQFTQSAREALMFAKDEAEKFNHPYLGTEHLLLGVMRVEQSIAAQVLNAMGVSPEKTRSAVEFIIGRGETEATGNFPLTPRSTKVLELALDEAQHFQQPLIGVEHILLGLIREGEGIAAGVLEAQGVSLKRLRITVASQTRVSTVEAKAAAHSVLDSFYQDLSDMELTEASARLAIEQKRRVDSHHS